MTLTTPVKKIISLYFCIVDIFRAQSPPGYLTPSNIQQVFSDELQVLKYRSNPEKKNKTSDIIKCTKECPEKKLLERVRTKAEKKITRLEWGQLGQKEIEYLKTPSERKSRKLQERITDYKERIAQQELKITELEITELKTSIKEMQKRPLDSKHKNALDSIAKGLKPDATAYSQRRKECVRLQKEVQNLEKKQSQLTSRLLPTFKCCPTIPNHSQRSSGCPSLHVPNAPNN